MARFFASHLRIGAALATMAHHDVQAIYPDNHFDYSIKWTQDNFESTIQSEIDAGKTVFVRWIASPGECGTIHCIQCLAFGSSTHIYVNRMRVMTQTGDGLECRRPNLCGEWICILWWRQPRRRINFTWTTPQSRKGGRAGQPFDTSIKKLDWREDPTYVQHNSRKLPFACVELGSVENMIAYIEDYGNTSLMDAFGRWTLERRESISYSYAWMRCMKGKGYTLCMYRYHIAIVSYFLGCWGEARRGYDEVPDELVRLF